MKKSILSLSLAVLSVLLICSCKDDDEVVLSTDCYISSFTLGNVKRQITTVNSAGRDTTYTISYSALYFPMTVNQLDGTIANKDSLPVNSDVKAVLATVESSGTVVYKKVSEGDDAWKAYSTSDSIDFTSPLTFRVYSPDYSASRDYTLQVNVHQQDGEVFSWEKVAEPAVWSAAEAVKTVVWKGRVWLYSKENGSVRVFTTALSDGKDWTEQPVSGCATADVVTLTEFGDALYMSGVDGTLMRSEDGLNWTACTADRSVRLLVADRTHLYALSDGRIYRSADGALWLEEALDETPAFLPVQDFATVSYTQENGLERTLWIGNRSMDDYPSDEAAMVWSHSLAAGQETAVWAYFNAAPDNHYACPRLQSLNLIRYGEVLLALGGKSLDGTAHKAFDNMYVSRDNGVTWKTDGVYVLPGDLEGKDVLMSVAVDAEYRVWLVAGDEVWRGRLNQLGFEDR